MYEYVTNLRIQSDKKQLNWPPRNNQPTNNQTTRTATTTNTSTLSKRNVTRTTKTGEHRPETETANWERRRVNIQPTNSLHPLTIID